MEGAWEVRDGAWVVRGGAWRLRGRHVEGAQVRVVVDLLPQGTTVKINTI